MSNEAPSVEPLLKKNGLQIEVMIRVYLRANKEPEAGWQERRKEEGFRDKVVAMWSSPQWNFSARFSERLSAKMEEAAKEKKPFDYNDVTMRNELIGEVAGDYIKARREEIERQPPRAA
jgi:hypothetical protein